MMVRDSYIMCIAVLPTKACAPLIVDAYAPLPLPVVRQFFQSITGWDPQIIDHLRSVDCPELAPGDVLHMRAECANPVAIEYRRGKRVGESADHGRIVIYSVSNVNGYYRKAGVDEW